MTPTGKVQDSRVKVFDNKDPLEDESAYGNRGLNQDFDTYQLQLIFKTITLSMEERCAAAFAPLAALFSGGDWLTDLHGSIARSDRKLYCYIQPIECLTQSIQTAPKIHIGSGHI